MSDDLNEELGELLRFPGLDAAPTLADRAAFPLRCVLVGVAALLWLGLAAGLWWFCSTAGWWAAPPLAFSTLLYCVWTA